MTNNQTRAIQIIIQAGAENAGRACDLSEDARGIYDDADEIIAYGIMPNSNVEGWYFAGYADEIVRFHAPFAPR